MELTQQYKDRNQCQYPPPPIPPIPSSFLGGSVDAGEGAWASFGGLIYASGGVRGIAGDKSRASETSVVAPG